MTGFESKSRQSLCKRASTSAPSRSRSISRYLPIRTFFTSRIPRCCIASRTAAPCGSSTATFGITTTLAFICSIYEHKADATMVFSGLEISFKAHIAALVVAANGSTARHANAIARSARDGLFRQRLPDSYYRWPCSRGRFCGWQRLRAEPRHPRFHVDRASPDPGTAVKAGGTTSGESEIGHDSQRGEEPSGNHH